MVGGHLISLVRDIAEMEVYNGVCSKCQTLIWSLCEVHGLTHVCALREISNNLYIDADALMHLLISSARLWSFD